eukprot:scaffold7550_cov19-Tisochrysis_lutea.AAC.3
MASTPHLDLSRKPGAEIPRIKTWECAGLLQPAKRWLCPEQDIAGDGGGCASADFAALVMLLSTVEYWPTIPPVHAVMPLP